MIGLTALALMTAASAQPADPGPRPHLAGPRRAAGRPLWLPERCAKLRRPLGEYIVMVPGIQDAPDDQLRCAAEVSLKTDYYISFRTR